MPILSQRVLDALTIREWALLRLGFRAAPHGVGFEATPLAGDDAWLLFLRAERCALLLERAGAELPAAADRLKLRETQQLLSARAQLGPLDALAVRLGHPAVLLKSTRHAAAGEGVPANDMDVLVAATAASTFARALEERGYRGSSADLKGQHHLAPRRASGLVPIELHTGLRLMALDAGELLGASLPLEGWRVLRGLRADHHLLHLLVHSTLQHPHRRGRLRDLAMIRSAAARCTDAEITGVNRFLASHPEGRTMERQLDLARGTSSADPYRAQAAVSYLAFDHPGLMRRRPLLAERLVDGIVRRLSAAEDGGLGAPLRLDVETRFGALRALDRVSGPLRIGTLARTAWQHLQRLAIALPARLLAWKIIRELPREHGP